MIIKNKDFLFRFSPHSLRTCIKRIFFLKTVMKNRDLNKFSECLKADKMSKQSKTDYFHEKGLNGFRIISQLQVGPCSDPASNYSKIKLK